ncbi:MAG: hypothetical protein J5741_07485 [Bacteroidales bacterium]|nr:hypothetical protein [Bacteroidales bacterium]
MKQIVVIIGMLLCLYGVAAQNSARDYKASLDIPGWTSFVVSPSGEIWMSDNYNVWHTIGMSDTWKAVPHPYSYAVDFSYVVCPDTNTVLIFGRIFDPSDTNSRYNKYLRSADGGKTWQYLSMPYRMQRDKICVVGCDGGQVWLRVDSIMYLSTDKGLHFQEIAKIPDPKFRFDMDDNGQDGMGRLNWKDSMGISRESLVMTRDNWAHYEKIPTPYDQHPEIKKNYFFYSFAICRSKMVMEQADRYFWTSIDSISWREIPLNIRDFAVDRQNEEWVMVTRENQMLRSADLITFDTVNTNGPCYFTVIKQADRQAVYGLSFNEEQFHWKQGRIDSLYRITAEGMTACGLYTENIPLRPNQYFPVYRHDGAVVWKSNVKDARVAVGSSPQDLIFFDQHDQRWYRHLKTPFTIREVQVGTGKLAGCLLLSDGAQQYLVKMDTPEITPFRYERPLDKFLKSPVVSVDIEYKFHACEGQSYSERVLYRLEDNDFVIKKLSLWKKGAKFTHTFTADQLRQELEALNTGYNAAVRVSDLGFTQADYDSLRRYFSRSIFDVSVSCDSATRERILVILPQLDDSIWTKIIKSYQEGGCTAFSTFKITFQNKAGKSLVVSCTDDACNYGFFPYMTPFQIQCDNLLFPATSLPFMRFVGEIKGPSMKDANFSNFSLLMKAYRYVLWHREAFGI